MADSMCLFDAARSRIEVAMVVLATESSNEEKAQARSNAARAFMDAKESSRRIYLTVSAVKQGEVKSMEMLDSYHLTLQNLRYREDRLNEEVKLCRNYKCLGLERIAADRSVRIAKILAEHMTVDSHGQKLDKLKAELEARRKLDTEQKSLQAKKRKVQAEIKERRGSLGKLPSYLQVVRHACKPLAHLVPGVGQRHRVRDMIHGLLPRPLSVIYSQLEGVLAGGLLGDATGLVVEKQSPTSMEWSGLVIERSTSSVKLIFAGIDIVFYTLPSLGDTIVVEPSDGTLIDVFPGDNGDRINSPRTIQGLMNRGIVETAAFPSTILGRPFSWAQWLGGLAIGPLAHGKLEPSSRLLARHLSDRLANSAALQQQLENAAKQPPPVSCPSKGPPSTSALDSWAIYVPNSDPFVSTVTRLPTHRMYYKCAIRCQSQIVVIVTVELSPDYPYRAPRFLLQPRDGSVDSYSPHLKIVEAKVNAHDDGFVGHFDHDSYKCVLTRQLRKLQLTAASTFNSTTSRAISSKRTTWGRSRLGCDR